MELAAPLRGGGGGGGWSDAGWAKVKSIGV